MEIKHANVHNLLLLCGRIPEHPLKKYCLQRHPPIKFVVPSQCKSPIQHWFVKSSHHFSSNAPVSNAARAMFAENPCMPPPGLYRIILHILRGKLQLAADCCDENFSEPKRNIIIVVHNQSDPHCRGEPIV